MKFHLDIDNSGKAACGAIATRPDTFVYNEAGFTSHHTKEFQCKKCLKILETKKGSPTFPVVEEMKIGQKGAEFFWGGNYLMQNNPGKFSSTHRMEINTETFNPSQELKAYIIDAVNQHEQLSGENESIKKFLESLTPGGSEFHNDPVRCFSVIKEQMQQPIRIMTKMVAELKADNTKMAEELGLQKIELEATKRLLSQCEKSLQERDEKNKKLMESNKELGGVARLFESAVRTNKVKFLIPDGHIHAAIKTAINNAEVAGGPDK